MNYKLTLPLFLLIISLYSCARYKAQYANKSDKISKNSSSIKKGAHTFFLIGDAGGAPKDTTTPLFQYLKKDLELAGKDASILFLGDNIYPVGMPPEGHIDRAFAEHRMRKQLETLDSFEGKIIFVPGNHDWYEYGPEGIKRQEIFVENYLNKSRVGSSKIDNQNYFIPDRACGDPHAVQITEQIVLIAFDSHWFVEDYENKYDFSHCTVKTKQQFEVALNDLVKAHADKLLIYGMHHPPYTFGSHGGHFPGKDHIFPLHQLHDALLIPLPVAGYIGNKMRSYLSSQDTKNKNYKALKRVLFESIPKDKKVLFAAGHEHNLQYIENDGHFFVVSGSGSKNNPCNVTDGSQFCIGEKGYVKAILEESGEVKLHYIIPDKSGKTATIVFEKNIKLE